MIKLKDTYYMVSQMVVVVTLVTPVRHVVFKLQARHFEHSVQTETWSQRCWGDERESVWLGNR